MASLSTIRSQLQSKLASVTQLQQVLNAQEIDFSAGFPGCAFYLSGFDTEDLVSNAPNYVRSWRFSIEVYQEITNKTKLTAEADLEDAVEGICTVLEANWSLGANVMVSTLTQGTKTLIDTNQGPCLKFTLTFVVKTVV